jgi:hypothetical protein
MYMRGKRKKLQESVEESPLLLRFIKKYRRNMVRSYRLY